jgi:glutathione S-transferase
MGELILHHYAASPFAEKIRLVLGYKSLEWRSVVIPEVMPKPDLLALTGGYRRTPVLQIGADVYCDTSLILSVLEQTKPKPSLFAGHALADRALCHWAETQLFNTAVPLAFQGPGLAVMFPGWGESEFARFREDRAAMRKGGTVRRGPPHECMAHLLWLRHLIDAQLADGRAFLLGEQPCGADFAVYHPLWALRRVAHVLPEVFPFAADGAAVRWMNRIAAFGHGRPASMTSAEAVEAARAGRARPVTGAVAVSTGGIEPGDTVEVLPVDYAFDAVRGRLMKADVMEIWLLREDPRAGTVMVHFPRLGYEIRKCLS